MHASTEDLLVETLGNSYEARTANGRPDLGSHAKEAFSCPSWQ
jgi:hypothetical protein